ncbi:monofunctional biosynthetic peptidoglycan transglycosylase [Solimonas marina]|uniref:Biosynthetic peptidoglycan transglycosylase n=1 Tax=Solimonas marina TaxID=2714601 RepID=A0A969W916_9GAMM|nr:monofunctional biosynthetic peptidoglycan transglycosylase [Solimonas marina]NKF22228.1 monofunctional biosynthetic peptidoglycan transglycosylase [Solimonas marina]
MSKRRRRGPRLLLWLVVLILAVTVLPVGLLRWIPPPITSYMLRSPVKPVQYHWVPRSKIAGTMRKAVVASEDQKFYQHHGFDIDAIEKAREHNKHSKHIRGASTISQQTAKNLFLWGGGGYFRKGVEAGYTVLLEALWSKQRILEMYLNIAEFGPGIYGVEAASQHYFHHSAATLSATEAAHLTSVLPSPRHWSVTHPGSYVQRRVNWILDQMGYGGHKPDSEPEPEIPDDLQQQIDDDENGTTASAPAAAPTPAPAAQLEPDDEPLPPPTELPPPASDSPPPAFEPPPNADSPPSSEPSNDANGDSAPPPSGP